MNEDPAIDRRLKQLPLVRAPRTLLPRVMAAVQAWAGRPWYQRAWFTWPAIGQAAAFSALALLTVAVGFVLPAVYDAARGVTSASLADTTRDLSAIAHRVAMTSTIAQVLWRALIARALVYALAFVLVMGAAFAVCAVALNRALFGRPLPS